MTGALLSTHLGQLQLKLSELFIINGYMLTFGQLRCQILALIWATFSDSLLHSSHPYLIFHGGFCCLF